MYTRIRGNVHTPAIGFPNTCVGDIILDFLEAPVLSASSRLCCRCSYILFSLHYSLLKIFDVQYYNSTNVLGSIVKLRKCCILWKQSSIIKYWSILRLVEQMNWNVAHREYNREFTANNRVIFQNDGIKDFFLLWDFFINSAKVSYNIRKEEKKRYVYYLRLREGTLPWAIFRFRIFSNYFL